MSKTNIEVKIFPTKGEGPTKAFASVTLDGKFAARNIRIVDGQKGLFVAMPSETYEENGEKKYRDIFFPVNSDARAELVDAVMAAYEAVAAAK